MPLPTLVALLILPSAWLLERLGRLSPTLKSLASRLLIHFCYPCLILGSLPQGIRGDELLRLWPLPLATAVLLVVGRSIGLALLPLSQLQDDG